MNITTETPAATGALEVAFHELELALTKCGHEIPNGLAPTDLKAYWECLGWHSREEVIDWLSA